MDNDLSTMLAVSPNNGVDPVEARIVEASYWIGGFMAVLLFCGLMVKWTTPKDNQYVHQSKG